MSCRAHPPHRMRRRAFTLMEMLVVFTVAAIALGLLYELFYTLLIRTNAVLVRVEGETAVRILLSRIRQELRHAVRPVEISNFGTTQLTIPLMNPAGDDEDPSNPRLYFSRYTFEREARRILYERIGGVSAQDGEILESRVWMGGDTPVHSLSVEHTSENERILFQYYRVIVRVAYFDVKIRDKGKSTDESGEPKNLIHVSTTVYPRRINHELRIEVPQEGSML